jgi:hypothetical protein
MAAKRPQEYASAFTATACWCLPELEVVGLGVPRCPAAGCLLPDNLDNPRQGVWIPRIVVGLAVGNMRTVGTR